MILLQCKTREQGICLHHYRVIGSKIQRMQVTIFLPVNLTFLSDPGPDYVLADKVKRARAFFSFP